MRRRDSIIVKLLSLAALAGFISAVAVQLYTHSRMENHFGQLDEGIAVEALNRSLDVLQAEIKNLRIIARSFTRLEQEPDDIQPLMEIFGLNFLSISGNGENFYDATGYYSIGDEFGIIPDVGLFFNEVTKGPFTELGESEWGFVVAGENEQVYLLSSNNESESGKSVVTGRNLDTAMAYYLERRKEVEVDFKQADKDTATMNEVDLDLSRADRPRFPEVTAENVAFHYDNDGYLQSDILIEAPYLNYGLLIELTRIPEIRNTGFREARIVESLYLSSYAVFLLLISLWMIRVLSIPMGKLILAIQSWDGIRIPEINGLDQRRDEIGILAETFLRMSGEIVTKTRSLEEQAVRDGLTGLFNRRRFDESFISEWDRHKRQGLSLAVVMADIDFFKKYNDRYGHPEGDVCLRRVARICSGVLHRPGDIAFRYGGEEFIFLLSDTDQAGAEKVAEAIRVAVEKSAILHEGNPKINKVTVSLGVASSRPSSEPGKSERSVLLNQADQALYKAKETGRNRVASIP